MKGMKHMKTIYILIIVGMMAVLSGCASVPVRGGAGGPNPEDHLNSSTQGGLEVYSRLTSESDDGNQGSKGPNPGWYAHTAYTIYDLQGSLVRRAQNDREHYGQDPTLVKLAPGDYTVKAESADYFWVSVPVTVETGKITRVH